MAIADRKEREKEQRRNDILNAAEKLFFSKGYDNVSMDDIAKEIEFSKPTIYIYFKDKESLFFAVVLRGTRIIDAIIKENVSSCKTGGEKLRAIGKAYFDFVRQYPDYTQAYYFFRSGRFDLENASDNEYAKEIIELNDKFFEITRKAVTIGIEDGTVRPDVNPVEVAVLLTLIAEGIANMRPELKKVLEMQEITLLQFLKDVGDLERNMLMNIEKKDVKCDNC